MASVCEDSIAYANLVVKIKGQTPIVFFSFRVLSPVFQTVQAALEETEEAEEVSKRLS